jgi:hypothetical protein
VARDGERADRALAERIAVGRRFRNGVDADGERAAGTVVDDDGLAELFRERGRDDARDVVGRAASGLRNDETDGSLGKLRGRRPRSPESEKNCEELQGVICPRTSPPLLRAVCTFTYRLPAFQSFICSAVSLRPAGTV